MRSFKKKLPYISHHSGEIIMIYIIDWKSEFECEPNKQNLDFYIITLLTKNNFFECTIQNRITKFYTNITNIVEYYQHKKIRNIISPPINTRISIRLIENQDDLYATFSKRWLGLYKKASELSTLCGGRALSEP